MKDSEEEEADSDDKEFDLGEEEDSEEEEADSDDEEIA